MFTLPSMPMPLKRYLPFSYSNLNFMTFSSLQAHYTEVNLLCPWEYENMNPAYLGLFANNVSVLLPLITGKMEWALTCLLVISYYKQNSHWPSICVKCILLNYGCSFAILLQSVCHKQNLIRVLQTNITTVKSKALCKISYQYHFFTASYV